MPRADAEIHRKVRQFLSGKRECWDVPNSKHKEQTNVEPEGAVVEAEGVLQKLTNANAKKPSKTAGCFQGEPHTEAHTYKHTEKETPQVPAPSSGDSTQLNHPWEG